ncbi:MAG: hypothetical protein R3B45_01105 [Bdellovibrionota bacterium]
MTKVFLIVLLLANFQEALSQDAGNAIDNDLEEALPLGKIGK